MNPIIKSGLRPHQQGGIRRKWMLFSAFPERIAFVAQVSRPETQLRELSCGSLTSTLTSPNSDPPIPRPHSSRNISSISRKAYGM